MHATLPIRGYNMGIRLIDEFLAKAKVGVTGLTESLVPWTGSNWMPDDHLSRVLGHPKPVSQ